MSNQASANRYAKALLHVAIKEADPIKAEQEIAAFAGLFDAYPDLRRSLTNPAVPVQAKRAVVQELIARVQPSPPVQKLMALLADRDRLELVPDLLAAYRERLMEHQNVVRAEVVTAVPLAEERASQLRQKLQAVTGQTVLLETRVDPAIIGGLVARVGTIVYDGSIGTQLTRMKERLAENR
ncbi:MAG TPA: ATP synthase F1 subunit delta [Thermoanaerobaculia bacterium]|nr:ATP synthase F1 subunit delta [Thermoanaerobaculia bacterium]